MSFVLAISEFRVEGITASVASINTHSFTKFVWDVWVGYLLTEEKLIDMINSR